MRQYTDPSEIEGGRAVRRCISPTGFVKRVRVSPSSRARAFIRRRSGLTVPPVRCATVCAASLAEGSIIARTRSASVIRSPARATEARLRGARSVVRGREHGVEGLAIERDERRHQLGRRGHAALLLGVLGVDDGAGAGLDHGGRRRGDRRRGALRDRRRDRGGERQASQASRRWCGGARSSAARTQAWRSSSAAGSCCDLRAPALLLVRPHERTRDGDEPAPRPGAKAAASASTVPPCARRRAAGTARAASRRADRRAARVPWRRRRRRRRERAAAVVERGDVAATRRQSGSPVLSACSS